MACIRCERFRICQNLHGSMVASSAWTCEGLRCLNCGTLGGIPRCGDQKVCDEGRIPPPHLESSRLEAHRRSWLLSLLALCKGM